MATLKLNSQTVVSESSGTLTAPALNITTGTHSGTILNSATFPAGCVIQCHHILTSTRTSYSCPVGAGGTRMTELDLPITLKSSNSKIICQWQISGEVQHNQGFEIFKDDALATHGKNLNASNRYSFFALVGYDQDYDSTPHTYHIQYIDPSPTSATYNVRVSSSDSGTGRSFYLNRAQGSGGQDSYENGVSTGVIWEIMK